MIDPRTMLLLFFLFVGLVGMSVYVVWLQVNLWLTRQILNRAPTLMATPAVDSVKMSGGCVGSFGFALLIVVLVSVFAVLYF